MSKEQFEKWADSQDISHGLNTTGVPRAYAAFGWTARQPEIDAKDKVIDDLALQKAILLSSAGSMGDEIAALKAEVERLRNEREKVVRQAQQNDKLLFENAKLAGKLMQYEEPERYAEYCRVLDEKDAAMKETK